MKFMLHTIIFLFSTSLFAHPGLTDHLRHIGVGTILEPIGRSINIPAEVTSKTYSIEKHGRMYSHSCKVVVADVKNFDRSLEDDLVITSVKVEPGRSSLQPNPSPKLTIEVDHPIIKHIVCTSKNPLGGNLSGLHNHAFSKNLTIGTFQDLFKNSLEIIFPAPQRL